MTISSISIPGFSSFLLLLFYEFVGYLNEKFTGTTAFGHINTKFTTLFGHINTKFSTSFGHINTKFTTAFGHINTKFTTSFGYFYAKSAALRQPIFAPDNSVCCLFCCTLQIANLFTFFIEKINKMLIFQ